MQFINSLDSKEFLNTLDVCAETGNLLFGEELITRTTSQKKVVHETKKKGADILEATIKENN